MRKHSYNFFGSFIYAGQGLRDAIKKEPSLKIHMLSAVAAVVLGLTLGLTTIEWALLVLTISMVLVLELINTTIESLTDIVSPEMREAARITKDVAAAGVLVSAIAAAVIGALLFLPRLLPH